MNTHTHTHATVRSIFSQIDLQRNHSHAPHDLHLQNTHAIETKPHTPHTHRQVNLLSDRSSTQSFTSRLSAKYTRNRIKATHTCHRQVVYSQIDLQRNHSHAPHDLQLQNTHAIESNHTHTHRQVIFLRSIFNAIIHMRHTTYSLQIHAIETKPHTRTTKVNLLSDRSSTQSHCANTYKTFPFVHTRHVDVH